MARHEGRIARTALGSLTVGVCVLCLKLAAWAMTGSVAVLSDALESLVNIAAAVIALIAVRVASRPADEKHPHGHEKAEFLAVVAEAGLVVVAAIFILGEAIKGLIAPAEVTLPPLGLAALALATAVNLAWSRVLTRRGRALRSPALKADGKHLMADVVTSLGVFAGLAAVTLTGIARIDAAIALVVGAHVLWQGVRMLVTSASRLMDEVASPEEQDRIETVIDANLGGAIEAHDLKLRQLGRGLAVDVHLVVPAGMDVETAHDICDRIERALEPVVHGGPVMIHIEPERHARSPERMVFNPDDD